MNKLLIAVLALLGLSEFAKDASGKRILTDEQTSKLKESFSQEAIDKVSAALAENEASSGKVEELATAMKELGTLKADLAALKSTNENFVAETARLNTTIADQKKAITALTDSAEENPKSKKGDVEGQDVTNDKFLFGVNTPIMAIGPERPYNLRAYAALMNLQGMLIPTPKASSLDYQALKDDLGDFYRIRKQDRIQSFLQSLPSLELIFNLESNYQDRAILVNMFLNGDFSQADNTSSDFDAVVKGGYSFEPEEIRMFDVMFAHKFTDLKKLEKTWIGYLNKEGSSTMKWSFIEYILVETLKKLKNEQELRRINGKRKNPILNQPGSAMEASDGLRQFLTNQIALLKINPFKLGPITDTNIVEKVKLGTSMIPAVLRDSGLIKCYMSKDNVTKYHQNMRTLFGLMPSYDEKVPYVQDYPNVLIVGIANLAPSNRIFWTLAGNIILLEDLPGEMANFSMEQKDWTLKVWSNWKESLWAYLVGKKFNSAQEFPEDYSSQMIFVNDEDLPASSFVAMPKDSATPSVALHTSIVSVANTAKTALTDILDAAIGQQIKVKCGVTNSINIAKADKFSLIASAWNPAVGDVITLMKRADGKFIELKRDTIVSSAIAFAADDATPSVANGTSFVTDVNTVATAITNFTDAVEGVNFTVYGAGSTHASTIANAGNFVLSAAMSLVAGNSITLVKAADAKFYEVSRVAA